MRVLKFEADWCAPCKQMAPALKAIAGDFLETIDVDRCPDEVRTYMIRCLPTVLVLDEGKEVLRIVGTLPGWQDKLRAVLGHATK